jgi:hypothetical protein
MLRDTSSVAFADDVHFFAVLQEKFLMKHNTVLADAVYSFAVLQEKTLLEHTLPLQATCMFCGFNCGFAGYADGTCETIRNVDGLAICSSSTEYSVITNIYYTYCKSSLKGLWWSCLLDILNPAPYISCRIGTFTAIACGMEQSGERSGRKP